MASLSEHDVSCPICQEVFREPVLLSCSHSFCRPCLKTWWAQKPLKECPVCKRRSSREDPPLNLALKNLCESFVEWSGKSVCSDHSEKLQLFCFDDQELICLICRDSETHKKHCFSPFNEAVPQLKEGLDECLQALKDRLQVLNKSFLVFDAATAHVKAQARLTEKRISDEFKKLHQFLLEEEEVRMKALREEEEQKSTSLQDKTAAVSREIDAVFKSIALTEKQLGAQDIFSLMKYKAALERVQCCPLLEESQLGPGALIDEAKHLGNLGFSVWNNMKERVQFQPVILDPNTANPELVLSADLTSVSLGEEQDLPENPERLKFLRRVLGSERLSSGSHSWCVRVSGEDNWSVGVMAESEDRKGSLRSGVWRIFFSQGRYKVFSPPDTVKTLNVKKELQNVRVTLDFDKKTLTFINADTNSRLHTFKHSFSEKLYPYFQNYNKDPLRILPLNVSVNME